MSNTTSSPGKALDFQNTEVAFKYMTDKELKISYLLFKAIGMNWLVKLGPGLVKFSFDIGLPIKGLIKATVFRQFCGGESMNECEWKMKQLHSYDVGSILDYSIEGKTKQEEFDETADEVIRTIHKSKNERSLIPFCVFKPTGLARLELLTKVEAKEKLTEAEQTEYDRTVARIEKVCRTAYENNVRIFIDAEQTWIQGTLDEIITQMMMKFNKEKCIVYNTLQMYRHDRVDYLKKLYEHAVANNYIIGQKLVRGAYMEKERERAEQMGYQSPICATKEASDKSYDDGLRFCMEHLDRINICAGTHNEESCYLLAQLMAEKGIAKNDERIFFSQLLGMSDHISFNLAHDKYNVVKYLPYGPIKAVLPYLFRRAQENTSAKGQAGRELRLISKEVARRKGA
ncbi:MAG: proline dehydrogenase family protein [Bacteroidota bacterium]